MVNEETKLNRSFPNIGPSGLGRMCIGDSKTAKSGVYRYVALVYGLRKIQHLYKRNRRLRLTRPASIPSNSSTVPARHSPSQHPESTAHVPHQKTPDNRCPYT
jgi:hypothetical protein